MTISVEFRALWLTCWLVLRIVLTGVFSVCLMAVCWCMIIAAGMTFDPYPFPLGEVELLMYSVGCFAWKALAGLVCGGIVLRCVYLLYRYYRYQVVMLRRSLR